MSVRIEQEHRHQQQHQTGCAHTTRAASVRPPRADDGTTPRADGVTLRWVHAVLAETSTDPRSVAGVRVLRAGAKQLAEVELSDGTALVLKQYTDDRGADTQRWLHRLAEAGLTAPARTCVTATRGWSPTHRTLVTDLAPGDPWAAWVLRPDADRDAAAVTAADWLLALQSLPVALPELSGYRAGDDLRRQGGRLAVEHPQYAARLFRITDASYGRLYADADAPELVPAHGDLHPSNLFLAGGDPLTATAIDVDTAGLRRPAYDVGYALAQVLVTSWMVTGSFATGAAAGLVFWQRWSALGGQDAAAVPAELVRALVQSLSFELITYRTGRTELLDHWLGLAETVLHDGIPASLKALAELQELVP